MSQHTALQQALLFMLLAATWLVIGFCLVSQLVCPCIEHLFWSFVMLPLGSVLLWFVWPRKVVACGY